jgi:universal stress protein E
MLKNIDKILAVISDKDDGEIIIQKAMILAKANDASIQVVKIIYEGFVDLTVHDVEQSQALKSYLMQAEETLLVDLIDPVLGQGIDIGSSVLWSKYQHQGILDAAAEYGADLIVKPTNHPLTEIVRTPEDWNLLRHADLPVMLVKPIAWTQKPVVVAAVDVQDDNHLELSTRILLTAKAISHNLGGNLKVINAFPSVEHWVGPITLAIDFDRVRQRVRSEIEHLLLKLAEHCDVNAKSVHADEGDTAVVIESLVAQTQAEILVVGTSQRSGAKGIVLGNTSETILHHVNCDVLVLR